MLHDRPDPADPATARTRPGDPFHALVAEAYAAFAAPPPPGLGICTCGMCIGPERAAALRGRAARDWTLADVWGWNDSVVEGLDARTWAFLLPRFLEILAADETCHNGCPHLSLARVPDGAAAGYTAHQAAVLDRFAGLLLDRALARRFGPPLFDEVRLLAHGGWAPAPLAARLAADPDLPGALGYAWGLPYGGPADLFCPEWPKGARAVLEAAFVTPAMADLLLAEGLALPQGSDAADRALWAAEAILSRL